MAYLFFEVDSQLLYRVVEVLRVLQNYVTRRSGWLVYPLLFLFAAERCQGVTFARCHADDLAVIVDHNGSAIVTGEASDDENILAPHEIRRNDVPVSAEPIEGCGDGGPDLCSM